MTSEKIERQRPEDRSRSGGTSVPSYRIGRTPDDTRVDTERVPEEYRAHGPLQRSLDEDDASGVRREKRESGGSRSQERGTSWTSVVYGWLVSLGATIVLSGIIAGVVGALLGIFGVPAATGGISGAVGALVTLFVAYLVGGYSAGRMAGRSGLKHGIFVPLLTLLLLVLLGISGLVFGASLGGQATRAIQQAAPTGILQVPGATAIIAGALAVILPLVGGSVGGAWGATRTERA